MVATYGLAGLAVLASLSLGSIGFIRTSFAREAVIYLPLAMILILNPLSWAIINTLISNVGFRVFWAVPAAFLFAAGGLSLLRRIGFQSERSLIASAALALLAAIGWNLSTADPVTAIKWHAPGLKVNSGYDLARRLAKRTAPGCRILAPEFVSTWLTTIADAPYPVFARELQLFEYRFTMPAEERTLRERLRLVVEDGAATYPAYSAATYPAIHRDPSDPKAPSPASLKALRIPIGTIAVFKDAPSRGVAASLAHDLNLTDPASVGPLLVWSGSCDRTK
jgi:hypothetical protein